MTCDSSNLLVECEYCGGVVQIQNEIKKSMPEIDAEQSGYDFEKGRQRAQMEMGPSNVVYSQPSQPVNQKSHTWLWVLGWICFFPIPLSILIWRSRLDNKIKLILTGGLWVFILIVCVLYRESDRTRAISENAVKNRTTETVASRTIDDNVSATEQETTVATTQANTENTTQAAVQQKIEARTERNGWNPETNQTYDISGYSIKIPDCYEKEEKENVLAFQCKDDNKSYIILFCEKLDNKKYSASDFRSQSDEVADILYDNYLELFDKDKKSEFIMASQNTSYVSNLKDSIKYERIYNVKDDSTIFYIDIILDVPNDYCIVVTLIEDTKSELTSLSDFTRAVGSISFTGSVDSNTTEIVSRDQSDIRPEFKEMMDGYESFMDEYIAFMQNMSSDPSEMDAFTDYMDFLSKYSEWAQKIDDVDDSELTDAELNYYLEVTNRVTQKLLSAGVQ